MEDEKIKIGIEEIQNIKMTHEEKEDILGNILSSPIEIAKPIRSPYSFVSMLSRSSLFYVAIFCLIVLGGGGATFNYFQNQKNGYNSDTLATIRGQALVKNIENKNIQNSQIAKNDTEKKNITSENIDTSATKILGYAKDKNPVGSPVSSPPPSGTVSQNTNTGTMGLSSPLVSNIVTTDSFATCLKDKGAVFYGAFWCPHCQDQKKEFGSSAKLLPYIECSTPDGQAQTQICTDKKIEGYPTWIFADGSKLTGKATFEQLADKTSCPLPTNNQ